ncbi:MAG: MBL fold metallo-hydrolase [Gammaproteobacteria bacterium]|jgi:metallo-beta-lactamase family protein
MAKLTFLGSTEGVTGSLYLLEAGRSRVLLECGLIQGHYDDERHNRDPFPFDPKSIDAVVLSHAHLDHSGRLPKLIKEGYTGPVYMTRPTSELLDIMLKDAAYLSMRDAEWENKRRKRSGKDEIDPLYTLDDVERALKQFVGVHYKTGQEVTENVTVTYHDAGHILGSAIVELDIQEGTHTRKLVFSGDLGNSYAALLRDPVTLHEADMLMLESTYGDRNHRPLEKTLAEFRDVIEDAYESNGNVLIPAFAVGRTQEIIFYLGELYQQGILKQQAVFLDSPMAIAATEVYHRYQNIFNDEDQKAIRSAHAGTLHSFLPVLRYSRTTEESMAINNIKNGAIIIAGSGMCNGGRIRHHFKHNLWRRNTHVMIVGFQARGTPGRALVDGAKSLHVVGEDIAVNAKIHTLGGFSAHAGQRQLLDWAGNFQDANPRIFLVHGEDEAKQTLLDKLTESKLDANIAQFGQTIKI